MNFLAGMLRTASSMYAKQEIIVDVQQPEAEPQRIKFRIPRGAVTLACSVVQQQLQPAFGAGSVSPAGSEDVWLVPDSQLDPSTQYVYKVFSALGANQPEWDVVDVQQRRKVLMELFGNHIKDAVCRRSLTDEPSSQESEVACPVAKIGQKWGHVERTEIAKGLAMFLLANHQCYKWKIKDQDIKRRLAYAAVLANAPGSGKSSALRHSVFEALELLADPAFCTHLTQDQQYRRPEIARLAQHMMPKGSRAPLSFLYDFGREGNVLPLVEGTYGLLGYDHACVAWCFLQSVISGSQEPGTPKDLVELLRLIRPHVDGRELHVQSFKQMLVMDDVIECVRSLQQHATKTEVGMLWAWDEAHALPASRLQALAYAFISGARHREFTWTPLVIASTASLAFGEVPGCNNFQLIPMLPVDLESMGELVMGAWKYVNPKLNEGAALHPSVRRWLALVQGNLRLLECLLAAASGSSCWKLVHPKALGDFLSHGVADQAEASRVLTKLIQFTKDCFQLPQLLTCAEGPSSMLLVTLLGHSLLGDMVRADQTIAGTQITFALAQSLGICSLRPPPHAGEFARLQYASAQEGQVHIPAVIAYICYQALIEREPLSSKQPFLQGWDANMLGDMLVHAKGRELQDAAAVGLKVELLRQLHGTTTAFMGRLVPMRGATQQAFGGLEVSLPADLRRVGPINHEQLQEEARRAEACVMVGEGAAEEADSFVKLPLAYEPTQHVLITIHGKFHRAYDKNKDPLQLVIEEQQKAVVPGFPLERQLFVFCTDGQVQIPDDKLPNNIAIIDTKLHPAFYGSPGVLYRELVDQVWRSSSMTLADMAADRALMPNATDADEEKYLTRLTNLRRQGDIMDHVQRHKRLKLSMKLNDKDTKAAMAKEVIEECRRLRSGQ